MISFILSFGCNINFIVINSIYIFHFNVLFHVISPTFSKEKGDLETPSPYSSFPVPSFISL